MEKLADELAKLLSDYREAENLNPKAENVLKWVSQFSTENQSNILEEMIHICQQRYLTKIEVDSFLTELVSNEDLTKNNPIFWNNVSLLNIQKNGHSQKIMNKKFKKIIMEITGIDVAIDDNSKSHFIHVDDFLFTGSHLRHDLAEWFKTAPENAKLDIIYIGYYKSAKFYIETKWLQSNNPKNIDITFWRLIELENNTNCQNVSHVLWPIENILDESNIKEFLQHQNGYKLRDITQIPSKYCKKSLFSSEERRQILEKEFTIAGLKIINNINGETHWKPLGFAAFNGLGFGAMLFSYRNCPNNAPLALWWGDWDSNVIWYPLLQRKTYAPTAEEIFGRI